MSSFQPSDQCTNISYLLNGKHIQANHHVQQDGYYYYINQLFNMKMWLNRVLIKLNAHFV